MLAREVARLENENEALKKALLELSEKMEQNAALKPKSCQYCQHYKQHYVKNGTGYMAINSGFCLCGVPICKRGGKREPAPGDSCRFFELGIERP